MIDNISTSLLEAEELITLGERILKLLEDSKFKLSVPESTLGFIRGDIDALNKALSQDKASAFTTSIQEKDKRRDKALIGLRSYLEAHTFHLDENTAAIAEKLLSVFRKYGTRLHREGHAIQTTKMKLLIADLEVPENLQNLKSLQADSWLMMMKQENEAFEVLLGERNTEQSSKTSPQTNENKFALGNRLNKTLTMLELLEESSPDPEQKNTLDQINEAISQVMSIARSRKTRNISIKSTPIPEAE